MHTESVECPDVIIKVFHPYASQLKSEYIPILEDLAVNFDEICKEINAEFLRQKDDIRNFMSTLIADIALDGMPKFEWHPNNDPYDRSGELRYNGKLPRSTRVRQLIDDEYSGEKEPTYESGCGWRFNTYGDSLNMESIDVGETIMWDVLSRHIPEDLTEVDDLDFKDIIHDTFYDNTITYNFFFTEGVFDFLGISEDSRVTVFEFMQPGVFFLEKYKSENRKERESDEWNHYVHCYKNFLNVTHRDL